MKGKRLLKFMYINLFFPVICLYVMPKMRLAANKAVEDTLLYTPLETFMLLSFFIYGILFAVLAVMCMHQKDAAENVLLLSLGAISVGAAMYFIKKAMTNYYLGIYSYPYAALYFGVCVVFYEKFIQYPQKVRRKFRKNMNGPDKEDIQGLYDEVYEMEKGILFPLRNN